jgi:hypothetical protein
MKDWTVAASLISAAALIPLRADAQASPKAIDASAPGIAAKYDSAFTAYRGYREASIRPWAELNAEVGNIGGHKGIFGGGDRGATAATPAAQPVGETAPADSRSPGRGAPTPPAGPAQH